MPTPLDTHDVAFAFFAGGAFDFLAVLAGLGAFVSGLARYLRRRLVVVAKTDTNDEPNRTERRPSAAPMAMQTTNLCGLERLLISVELVLEFLLHDERLSEGVAQVKAESQQGAVRSCLL